MTTATHIADRLMERCRAVRSIACVGLDPRVELLPPGLRDAAEREHGPGPAGVAAAFVRFGCAIIDAVADACAVVKPQAACYEAYGAAGFRALEQVVAHARVRGVPVVMDAKRGDIGSTATHYRQGWFGGAPGLDGAALPPDAAADWITVNGYLGRDGVEPFLGTPGESGVFVLVRTSNPGSSDLQEQPIGAGTVAEQMARLVAGWGATRVGTSGFSDVGAVVGATWPQQAKALRALMPQTIFLVPGYGAQGGSAADALAGARSDGQGIIVNSSRGIIGAWQKAKTSDFAAAARAALDAMNADLAKAGSLGQR